MSDRKSWYKLDTAAKIYPAVVSSHQPNVFRLSCTLTEEVDAEILQAALYIAIKRYPTMSVSLQRGAFWFYFEENSAVPKIRPESHYPCQLIDPLKNQNFLFQVTWYDRRINLEIFHVITDGTGGMEFLKTIVFYYLLLNHKPVTADNLIKTVGETISEEEFENSFLRYYDPMTPGTRSEKRAFHFRGTPMAEFHSRAIHGLMSVAELLTLTRRMDATITEFLTAVMVQAYFDAMPEDQKAEDIVKISVPVNLRKILPSKTMRNFAFYYNIGESFANRAQPFDALLKNISDQLRALNRKEKIIPRINPNVGAELNPVMRAAPLDVKQFILRQAHRIVGDDFFTAGLSNLGAIQLPQSLLPFVERFDFGLSVSEKVPLNASVCSFQDCLSITFSSSINEKWIEKAFFRILTRFGLKVTILTSEDCQTI